MPRARFERPPLSGRAARSTNLLTRCYPHDVADLTFAQPARRNLFVPIALALAVLALATFLVLRFTPHTTADLTIVRTALYPIHTVFKSESIVVGRDQAQDDLYVLADLRIANHLRLPLFLKDFTATLVPGANSPEGNTPLLASAVEKSDLPTVYATFPALAKLAAAQNAPLLPRETQIDPGQTAEGLILLHFPTTEAAWNARQSASVTVAPYHQAPITVDLPNNSAAPQPTSK